MEVYSINVRVSEDSPKKLSETGAMCQCGSNDREAHVLYRLQIPGS